MSRLEQDKELKRLRKQSERLLKHQEQKKYSNYDEIQKLLKEYEESQTVKRFKKPYMKIKFKIKKKRLSKSQKKIKK